MSYGHQWTLKRDLTEKQWSAITNAVEQLAQDLPRLMVNGPFVEGYNPSGLSERLMVKLWQRQNKPPYRCVEGSTTLLDATGQAIQVHAGGPYPEILAGHDPFVFHRTAHEDYCKTSAAFYDRLVVGTFFAVQRFAPGALRIDSTDMEADHKRAAKAWATSVWHRPHMTTEMTNNANDVNEALLRDIPPP